MLKNRYLIELPGKEFRSVGGFELGHFSWDGDKSFSKNERLDGAGIENPGDGVS